MILGLKPRHGILLGLILLCCVVMAIVGRHATPQQLMTLAPVVERGTEVLKAVDNVGQAATRLSPEELARLDEEIQARLPAGPRAQDPELQREHASRLQIDQVYVQGILDRLDGLTHLQPKPHLRVIELSVPNAFALPGGTIIVTTGMIDMCDSEAELASVIAHEMGHHKLGHPLARIQYERAARKLGGPLLADLSTLGYALYSRGYSARDEEEADRQGLGMTARMDYHPQAACHLMARMQTRFGRPDTTPGNVVEEGAQATEKALRNYFATHPPFPDRIQKLERARVEMHLPVERRRWFLGTRNHRDRIHSLQRRLAEDFQVGPLD